MTRTQRYEKAAKAASLTQLREAIAECEVAIPLERNPTRRAALRSQCEAYSRVLSFREYVRQAAYEQS